MERVPQSRTHITTSRSTARYVEDPSHYESSRCLPKPEGEVVQITREIFDEDGDVLIRADPVEFLVSSKILALASPVFRAMFKPGFQEGNTLHNAKHPLELELPEDDPQALRLLFQILHFFPGPKYHTPSITLQLDLVQLADKYNCMIAIETECKVWLHAYTSIPDFDSAPWTAIAIAFLLRDRREYADLTARVALQSPRHSIENFEPPSFLPADFKDDIRRLRNDIMYHAIHEIEEAIEQLSKKGQTYENGLTYCEGCQDCKKSSQQERDELWTGRHSFTNYCDCGSRVIEFLKFLKEAGTWPISYHYEEDALTLWDQLKTLPERLSNHYCDISPDCPLILITNEMLRSLDEAVRRAGGLDLGLIPEFDEWDLFGSGL